MSSQLTASRAVRRGETVTTDGTLTTLKSIPIPLNQSMRIFAVITARRIAGSSGSAGDSFTYTLEATYKNVAGVVSLVGTLEKSSNDDQVAFDAAINISGISALVQVTGATNNSVHWVGSFDCQRV